MFRTNNGPTVAKTIDCSALSPDRITGAAWLKSGQNGSGQRGFVKALATVAVLQTTLELERLTKLFSREVAASVTHSSINYQCVESAIDLSVGRAGKHSCTFRLVVEKKDLGQLTFTRGSAFTDKECAMLEFLLSSFAYPLRNALQYELAFRASLSDPLTGISNRTAMETTLRREIALARRHHTPLSLIILDIDGLKQVNDKYGHASGDHLIKTVVDIVRSSLRDTDFLSRYGGDEFTILLSNTAKRGAAVLAENVRKKIRSVTCQFEDEIVEVSASIGVASLTSKDKHMDLFVRADRALYDAKRQGRNRVKIAVATRSSPSKNQIA